MKKISLSSRANPERNSPNFNWLGVYEETKTKHDNVPVYKQVHNIKAERDSCIGIGLLYREKGPLQQYLYKSC